MRYTSTILLVFLFSSSVFAAMTKPKLDKPADKSTNQASSVKLYVDKYSGAKEMIFQLSTSPTMSDPITRPQDYISSYYSYCWFNNLELNTTYYWRAKVKGTSDSSDWSDTWSFTTNDSIMFYSPRSNGRSWSPGGYFSWYRCAEYDSFELQADTTPAFNSDHLIEQSVKDTFKEWYVQTRIYELKYGNDYYYRVRGIKSGVKSDWSKTWYVTVLDSLRFLKPVEGGKYPVEVTFQWAGVGYEKYQLQIDTSTLFNSPALIDTLGTEGIYREHLISNLLYGQQYYARLRALTSYDTTKWTPIRFETLKISNYYLRVDRSSPPDADIRLNTRFYGSTGYMYQIDSSNQFNSTELVEFNTDTTWVQPKQLLFGVNYYARVKAYHETDSSQWSTPRTFDVRRVPSSYYPYQNRTEIGIKDSFTFSVSDRGVTGYQLQLSETNNFDGALLIDSIYPDRPPNGRGMIKFPTLKFNKDYFWRMRMWHTRDTSDWDYPLGKKFTTTSNVTLINPYSHDGFGRDAQITMEWEAIKHIDRYEVLMDTVEDFTSGNRTSYIARDSSRLYVNNLWFGRTYYWKVRALAQNDSTDWSETRKYKVQHKVYLDDPRKDRKDVYVTMSSFDWHSIQGTTGYILELDTNDQFTNPYVFADTVKNSFFHWFHTPAPLTYGQKYYWRVKVYHDLDTTIWSDVWAFTTRIRNSPDLLYPADSSVDIPLGINFSWTKQDDAASYVVEYAENPQFQSPLRLNVVGTNRSVALKPNTTYYWHVRGRRSDGHEIGDWSETWTFKTKPAMDVPVLVSPANNMQDAEVNKQTLKWEQIPGASYDIELSQFSSFSHKQSATTPATAVNFNNLTGRTTYYWRVRAKNVYTIGDWSDVWQFTTGRDLSVKDLSLSGLQLYPNPVNDVITIKSSDNQVIQKVSILDMNGRIVHNRRFVDVLTASISTEQLVAGHYVVRIQTNEGVFQQQVYKTH
jgi:hypothetical protein